jgi:predicted DNA-binding transcriptional regulator AlpA
MELEVVTLTRQDLTKLIQETVRVTVSEFRRDRVPPIMNKAQAADYLGKSVATINRYMREGMPFRKDGTGYPEFYRTELDRWINERIQTISGKTAHER